MLGTFVDAFGFSVLCCLIPSVLVSFFTPAVMWFFSRNKNDRRGGPLGCVGGLLLYTVRYIASVILLFLLSIVMWWAVLTFGGDEAATALAEPFIGEESAEAMLEDEAITP